MLHRIEFRLIYLIVILYLAGCSPVKVSLNSDFGFSLSTRNPEGDGVSNASITITDKPVYINKTTAGAIELGGSCKNLTQIQISINQVDSGLVDCTNSLWSKSIDTTAFPDGDVVFELKNSLNSQLLDTLVLRKDTVPPTVYLDASIHMSTNTPKKLNFNNISLSVNQTSDSISYSFKFGLSSSINCAATADYSEFIPLNQTRSLTLNDGEGMYLLCLLGKDAFGNEQTYSTATTYRWDLDTTAPDISLKSIQHLTYINSAMAANFAVEVYCSEENLPVTFIARDSANVTATGTSTCTSGAATYPFDFTPLSLAEGNIEFSATQSDSYGNSSGTVALATLLKDTLPPAFASSTVIDSTDYYNDVSKTPTITWSLATDLGSGLKEYLLGIGTSTSTANVIGFTTAISGTDRTPSSAFSTNTLYYAVVKAVDQAGNETMISSNGWKVVTSAPTVTMFDDGLYSIPGKTPLMSWTLGTSSSAAPLAAVELKIGTSEGGSEILGWTDIGNGTNAVYSHSNLNSLEINTTYYATIRVKDSAGNIGPEIEGNGFVIKPSISKVVGNDGAFAAIMTNGRVIVWGDPSYGGNYAAVPNALKNGTVVAKEIVATANSFAVLTSSDAVYSWGSDSLQGTVPINTILNGNTASAVDKIYSNRSAFAAILKNGSVAAWGQADKGGDNVPPDLDGSNGPANYIVSTTSAFAAVRGDDVFTWGHQDYGGDNNEGFCKAVNSGCDTSATPALELTGSTVPVKAIKATGQGFILLRNDGQIYSWGTFNGNQLSTVGDKVSVSTNPVISIFTNSNAVAVVRNDRSVVAWGVVAPNYGGALLYYDPTVPTTVSVEPDLNNVDTIFENPFAFAAVLDNGSVVTWGDYLNGGNSSNVIFDSGVKSIFSTNGAFAAILQGSDKVVAWGDSNKGGYLHPSLLDGNGDNKATSIVGTRQAFAALRPDGSVVTWGHEDYGGTSKITGGGFSSINIASYLNGTRKIKEVYSNPRAFVAVYDDNTFVTWGDRELGGYSESINPK